MKGSNPRPVHRPVILIAIALFLLLYILWDKRGEILLINHNTPKIVLKVDSVKFKDSIYYEDKKILDKLIPVLKKREGFSDTVYSHLDSYIIYDSDKIHYTCHLKENYYIGYGHFLKCFPGNPCITKHQADSLLRADIRRAYFERLRLMRKTLLNDVKSIFISGKLGVK